jgi:hypothetical protein
MGSLFGLILVPTPIKVRGREKKKAAHSFFLRSYIIETKRHKKQFEVVGRVAITCGAVLPSQTAESGRREQHIRARRHPAGSGAPPGRARPAPPPTATDRGPSPPLAARPGLKNMSSCRLTAGANCRRRLHFYIVNFLRSTCGRPTLHFLLNISRRLHDLEANCRPDDCQRSDASLTHLLEAGARLARGLSRGPASRGRRLPNLLAVWARAPSSRSLPFHPFGLHRLQVSRNRRVQKRDCVCESRKACVRHFPHAFARQTKLNEAGRPLRVATWCCV